MTFAILILVKATIAMALGLSAAVLAKRSRAAVRHSILVAAFGVVLTLPLVSGASPEIRIPVLAPQERLAVSMQTPEIVIWSGSPGAAPEAPLPQSAPEGRFTLGGALAGIWCMGVAVSLLPLLAGLWQIRSLRRSGQVWPRGQQAAGVDVILHEAVAGPATWGIARPLIVLPPDAGSWSEENLDRALRHELEHVRRRDSLTGLLARFACAIYWFHPLVWIGRRRLLLEAELCCDDAVLRGSDATRYADQLVALAKRHRRTRSAAEFAMADRAELATRIRALLDDKRPRGPLDARDAVGLCASAALLLVAFAPVVLVAQAPLPKFEVASVKPIDRATMSRDHEGRRIDSEVFIDRTDVLSYIVQAYLPGSFCVMKVALGYDCSLIEIDRDVPGWMRTERFEIQAKLPPNSPDYSERQKRSGDTPRVNLMLRALLEERFHLKTYVETREIAVYTISVAKEGHKLKTHEGSSLRKTADGTIVEMHGMVSSLRNGGRGQILFQASSIAEAIDGLGNYFDRPLLDRTGLTGEYDFTLDYEADTMPVEPPTVDKTSGRGGNFANPYSGLSSGALSAALQDVGLKLDSTKARVEVLVIDSVEWPTQN